MSSVTLETIRNAGVVGAGGAGFPAHVKLSNKAQVVILNAAECEPLLHKDKELLRTRTDEIISGLAIAMQLTGAAQGIIGIKEKYKDVIGLLKGMLPANVTIKSLPDAYPAGDEFVLVYLTLGRVVPPGTIPLAVGAVVINVESALNIAAASATPVVEKFVSVAGAVANPLTLRVPVGVTLAQCVAAAGGAVVDDPNYVVGGVMMGYLEPDREALVDKTTGAVIVLPTAHVVVRRRSISTAHIQRIGRAACDQCSFCTELCPRYLLGHPIQPHLAMRNLGFNLAGEANVLGTNFCCECNLCSLYSCPEDLDPRNVCVISKRALAQAGKKWPNPPFNPKRPDMHLVNRQAPTRRLMTKLDLLRFNNVGPLRDDLLAVAKVGIKLKQHIGSPCEPVVTVGQKVRKGDKVGDLPVKDNKPAMGAPVHASIDGKVTAIHEGVVWIEKE